MSSKKLAILTILGLLLLGGAGFGFYMKKMNTEGFRGIGFSVGGVEKNDVDDWIKTFEGVLAQEEVLKKIITESDYANKLELPEGEALEHLREAVDVNYSKTRSTIQVGLKGKRKQNVQLDEISRVIFTASAPFVAQVKPAFGAHYQQISKNR